MFSVPSEMLSLVIISIAAFYIVWASPHSHYFVYQIFNPRRVQFIMYIVIIGINKVSIEVQLTGFFYFFFI